MFRVNAREMNRRALAWTANRLDVHDCGVEGLPILLCDDRGRTHLVKSRSTPLLYLSTSFDFREKPDPFDFFVGLIFERDPLRPTLGMKVRWADFEQHLVYNQNGPRFRWSKRSPINEAITWIR